MIANFMFFLLNWTPTSLLHLRLYFMPICQVNPRRESFQSTTTPRFVRSAKWPRGSKQSGEGLL